MESLALETPDAAPSFVPSSSSSFGLRTTYGSIRLEINTSSLVCPSDQVVILTTSAHSANEPGVRSGYWFRISEQKCQTPFRTRKKLLFVLVLGMLHRHPDSPFPPSWAHHMHISETDQFKIQTKTLQLFLPRLPLPHKFLDADEMRNGAERGAWRRQRDDVVGVQRIMPGCSGKIV